MKRSFRFKTLLLRKKSFYPSLCTHLLRCAASHTFIFTVSRSDCSRCICTWWITFILITGRTAYPNRNPKTVKNGIYVCISHLYLCYMNIYAIVSTSSIARFLHLYVGTISKFPQCSIISFIFLSVLHSFPHFCLLACEGPHLIARR